jgi:hypothetical protein
MAQRLNDWLNAFDRWLTPVQALDNLKNGLDCGASKDARRIQRMARNYESRFEEKARISVIRAAPAAAAIKSAVTGFCLV